MYVRRLLNQVYKHCDLFSQYYMSISLRSPIHYNLFIVLHFNYPGTKYVVNSPNKTNFILYTCVKFLVSLGRIIIMNAITLKMFFFFKFKIDI